MAPTLNQSVERVSTCSSCGVHRGGRLTRRLDLVGGGVSTDDVVVRTGMVTPRHVAKPETGGIEQAPALITVPEPESTTWWRRAGFGLSPVTFVIDLTAVLTASYALSLSARSFLLLAV